MSTSILHLPGILTVAVVVGCVAQAGRIATPDDVRARAAVWDIHPSLGLDAVAFLGVLSGDKLQSAEYAREVALFRPRLTPQELAALAALGEAGRKAGYLVGPFLAYRLSVGATDTFDDVLRSAASPEVYLRAAYERTPYWNAQGWPFLRARLEGDVTTALRGLRRAGFENFWREEVGPAAQKAATRFTAALAPHDVISEQQRFLDRRLEPTIQVVLLHFSRPYGMSIAGQRFVTHYGYLPAEVLLTAAHENFHPPFDLSDNALINSLSLLRDDPWMVSILRDHDPSFGYNSFVGLLDEDSAEALDQIVAERLGFAREAGERWRKHDGGMHLLAAALYRAMKREGFDRSGGSYETWLRGAVARGVLLPLNVKQLAAEVVGPEAVAAWGPHRAAKTPNAVQP